MVIAEVRVATERASRYLVQLCEHINLVASSRTAGPRARVGWSDERGVISFDTGRCTLRAEQNALFLRVEATDEDTLHHLEQRLTGRLEQVGRRDRLTVAWTPPTAAAGDGTTDEGTSAD